MPSEQSVVAELERAHAVDHRQHPAAQRRQAGDMRRGARHRDQRVQLDHRFDRGGGQRDALAGDGHDQQQARSFAPPRAPIFSAISSAGAIVAIDALVLLAGRLGLGAQPDRLPRPPSAQLARLARR